MRAIRRALAVLIASLLTSARSKLRLGCEAAPIVHSTPPEAFARARPDAPAPTPMSVTASEDDLAVPVDHVLHDADFERVRRLIRAHAGIHLHAGKHAMVHSRLVRRLRESNFSSFHDYLDWLEMGQHDDARAPWQSFVNCLTTNLTSFFREEHHFSALADELRARARDAGAPLRIWCNAASTGEEPYSLAMTARQALGKNAAVNIVASDIDTDVLAKAAQGVYSANASGLHEEQLRQFFLRGTGTNSGQMRVKPELASLIEFRHFNLMGRDWESLGGAFEIVFCRNVMIYFDRTTQRELLARIHRAMKPGGLLFVGHAENFSDVAKLFRLRGKTVYERVAA